MSGINTGMSKLDWTKNRRPGAILGGRVPCNQTPQSLPQVMPFGKYKDLPIRDLPTEYVHWLITEMNKKPSVNTGLYLALVERIS